VIVVFGVEDGHGVGLVGQPGGALRESQTPAF
jgi:hypothetical protein